MLKVILFFRRESWWHGDCSCVSALAHWLEFIFGIVGLLSSFGSAYCSMDTSFGARGYGVNSVSSVKVVWVLSPSPCGHQRKRNCLFPSLLSTVPAVGERLSDSRMSSSGRLQWLMDLKNIPRKEKHFRVWLSKPSRGNMLDWITYMSVPSGVSMDGCCFPRKGIKGGGWRVGFPEQHPVQCSRWIDDKDWGHTEAVSWKRYRWPVMPFERKDHRLFHNCQMQSYSSKPLKRITCRQVLASFVAHYENCIFI